MPRNSENKRTDVVWTPAQFAALVKVADEANSGIADLIRQIMIEKFPSIPDDLPRRGKYKRRR